MNKRAVRGVVLWGLLGTLVVPRSAYADAAAQARFHDEQARTQYDRGRYEQALAEFFLEQRLAANPRIAFNIALCFEQLKRLQDAHFFFGEYLASDDLDEERRKYAEDAMNRITPKVALVEVTSTPPGARIYVDEREHGDYGTTPRSIALAPGLRHVSVELRGYRKAEIEVDVHVGATAHAALTPDRIEGTLHVESPAAGKAEIRTPDGVAVASGATPFDALLPPGPYGVVVTADGYLPWQGVASVRESDTTTHMAAPQKIPAPTGDVTVTTNVPGALIELDGEPAGFTPAVLPSIVTGSHDLRVRRQGLVPWSGAVPVAASERSWVTVTLEEPEVTTRSPATWVVGGVGAALLVGAGIVGILAANAHSDFENTAATADRRDAIDRGNRLNVTTDVLLATGLVAVGTGLGLYFGTAQTRGRPSTATVSRGER